MKTGDLVMVTWLDFCLLQNQVKKSAEKLPISDFVEERVSYGKVWRQDKDFLIVIQTDDSDTFDLLSFPKSAIKSIVKLHEVRK